MRILGTILIILSTTLLGTYFGNIYGFRVKDLKEIRKALVILKSEIDYTQSPLHHAAFNISEKLSMPISKIFKEFSNLLKEKVFPPIALEKSFSKYASDTYLTTDDFYQLNSFGKTLGYLDKNLQISTINLTISYLDERIEEQMLIYLKNKKLYQTLGILSGLLVVVVLI
ncbi:MAG: stage III sporulation protein AB [Defluviitaleaceae bacterium]|nr:stage III sporulation protein AB [Defluviitaleaceae bacterium]